MLSSLNFIKNKSVSSSEEAKEGSTADFELSLEGNLGNVISALLELDRIQQQLVNISREHVFTRPLWELMRHKQQEYNQDNLVSINLLPSRTENKIIMTYVTYSSNQSNVIKLAENHMNIITKEISYNDENMKPIISQTVSKYKNQFCKNYNVFICVGPTKLESTYFSFYNFPYFLISFDCWRKSR